MAPMPDEALEAAIGHAASSRSVPGVPNRDFARPHMVDVFGFSNIMGFT
jgi:hypothetical protein